MPAVQRLITPRAALLAALGLMSLNYAFTARWAAIPGSLHGAKQPVFLAILAVTILLAIVRWPCQRAPLTGLARAIGWTGVGTLCVFLFVWFPPASWSQIPMLDNWPARYLSTLQGIDLLRHGSLAGWEWHYLGGYQISSDITQSLTLLAFMPVTLLGPAVGFHLLHVALFLAPPLLVLWDLSTEDDETRFLAAGLTVLTTASLSYMQLRSGDTNSLAGLACLGLTLAASHAAARAPRFGGALLIGALVALVYAHVGFFLYASLFLVVEALFYRDPRRVVRAAIAVTCAVVAGMPQYWESWRYPQYFIPNNVLVDPHARFSWSTVARNVFYNIELLWQPGRWRNDFVGLANVCLPVTAYVAWRVRSRAGFYAWVTLAAMLLLRFNSGEFGYVFERPMYVLALSMGPVLAVFLSRFVTRSALVVAAVALIAAYLQLLLFRVPHVPTLRDAAPALVDRVNAADGALTLVENTPHRDMDLDNAGVTEPAPVDAHVEQVLGTATGRRLYAGFWDGWQWTPVRTQVLAGGAFRGRSIATVPVDDVTMELRKWGVRHLIVWSRASVAYFSARPQLFAERWIAGVWHDFEYLQADTRAVVVGPGEGRLAAFDPLSARIDLSNVRHGSMVVVRTNYHPSWSAVADGTNEPVPLRSHDGQLAFDAPRDGSYAVRLVYARRRWLLLVALAAVVLGAITTSRVRYTGDRAGLA